MIRLNTPKEGREKGGIKSEQVVEKKGKGLQCIECQDFGHLVVECPNRKKKASPKVRGGQRRLSGVRVKVSPLRVRTHLLKKMKRISRTSLVHTLIETHMREVESE